MYRSKAPVTFILAIAMVLASAVLIMFSGASAAEEAPSLTVVATLSAFVIALCFRQLGTTQAAEERGGGTRAARDRKLLTAALVIATATLLADARIVIRYRSSPVYPSNPWFKR